MAKLVRKGGKGSGNWGHAGRHGKVGGSAPKSGAQPALFDVSEYDQPPTPFEEVAATYTPETAPAAMADPPDGYDGEAYQNLIDKLRQKFVDDVDGTVANDARVIGYLTRELMKIDPTLDADDIYAVFKDWHYSSNGDADMLFLQGEAANMFHDVFGTELSGWQRSRALYVAMYGKNHIPNASGQGSPFYNNADAAVQHMATQQGQILADSPADARIMEQKILRAMYNHTQKVLRDAGVDGVYVYRGIRADADGVHMGEKAFFDSENALSSWSTSPDVARSFAADVSPMYPSDLGVKSIEDVPPEKMFEINSDGYITAQYIPRERILSIPFTGMSDQTEDEVIVINGGETTDDEQRVVSVYRRGISSPGDEEPPGVFYMDWETQYENNVVAAGYE